MTSLALWRPAKAEMDSARLPSGLSTVRSNEPEVGTVGGSQMAQVSSAVPQTDFLKPAGLLDRTAPMPKQGQKRGKEDLNGSFRPFCQLSGRSALLKTASCRFAGWMHMPVIRFPAGKPEIHGEFNFFRAFTKVFFGI